MSAGLDVWPTEKANGQNGVALMEACRVIDGRLAARLTAELGRKISFFLTPAEAPERAGHGVQAKPDLAFMPFVRFPNWYFCPRCRVLKQADLACHHRHACTASLRYGMPIPNSSRMHFTSRLCPRTTSGIQRVRG